MCILKIPVWYIQEKFLLNSFYTAKANHTPLCFFFVQSIFYTYTAEEAVY